MTNPLALLPLALAAGGGRIDEFEAQQLVAAGLTLLQRSAAVVRALAARRGAILLPTSPAYFTALAACDGRAAVLINPLAARAEIAFQCTDAGVGAVFTSSALAERIPDAITRILLDDAPRSARVVSPDGTVRDIDLGSHFGFALEGEADVSGRDEEAAIVYTSAMQGTPLGAVLTHRNMLANARSTVDAMANTADDHVLALLPFSHLFGLTVTAVAPLLVGARVTTMARFHPGRAADLLAGDVTEVAGVPAIFAALLGAIEKRQVRLTDGALRLCICGGAVLPRALQDRWFDVTGLELHEGYGLTEAGPVSLFNRADRPNVRGTLGLAMPGVDVRIFPPARHDGLDAPDERTPLPDGAAGEICIRGENVSPGYVNGALGLPRRGEWLCSGDEGVRNSDGTIRFLGLIKPMFTRNGFNVYPRELERAICAMPGVVRADVEAISEEGKENAIRMRVFGNVTEGDVRRWCEERLSAYKQPAVVDVVA